MVDTRNYKKDKLNDSIKESNKKTPIKPKEYEFDKIHGGKPFAVFRVLEKQLKK